MQVEITKLNHSGEGMATIEGKIIFVPKALPGDMVELKNIIDHGSYFEAAIKSYIKKSPTRVSIPCPYYQSCGGCQIMGLSYQEQLTYKIEKVANILKKYSNLEPNLSIQESTPYQYRNKIILQVQNSKIGLFQPNSNTLVPIEKCLLISPQMNQLIKLIQANINLTKIKKIMIRESQQKQMIQIIGTTDKNTLIKTLSQEISSIYLNNQLIYGLDCLEDQLGKYRFLISPASFFQVNHEQTINLYNQVKKYLGKNNNHVLDLYCGTGTIGIYVSSCCKKITGIELNTSSVKDAKKNININRLNHIKILEGDVGKILKAKEEYDAIIVDPPRSGLDKRTRQILLKIKSKKIIYISCNPITLARDLNQLKQIYEIKEISLFDMFPNTYHVECCSLLCLKENQKAQ